MENVSAGGAYQGDAGRRGANTGGEQGSLYTYRYTRLWGVESAHTLRKMICEWEGDRLDD